MATYTITGETLTSIADAIRGKTGSTDKMLPTAFAQAITDIKGGGGEEMESTWKAATGTFTPTENGVYTIVHNLGVMPDFFLVWSSQPITVANGIICSTGFSQEVFDAAGDSLNACCSVYSTGAGAALTWKLSLPMETDNTTYPDTGAPFAPTPVSVRVGGANGVFQGGKKYEWMAFGGVFGGASRGKYSLAATMNDIPDSGYAINNDGTRFVTGGPSPAGGRPAVYDISGEAPVWLTTPTTNSRYSAVRYNVDDTKLVGYGRTASGTGSHILSFDVKADAYTETKTTLDSSATGTYGYDASPVNGGYACAWYASTKHYGRIYTGSQTVAFTVTYAERVRNIAYSHDGAYIAVACYGGKVQIYNASTGTLYKTITTGYTSAEAAYFTMGNKKLVVSLSVAPWVVVYDFVTGAKLDGFDFTDFVTAKPQILVIPCTNELVIGLGSTVRIFDLSGDAPAEITGLPTFGGTQVSSLVANKNGTRLAISSYNDKHAEVWKRG